MRGALLIVCLTAACARAQESLSVRVLPQPLSANRPASRLGLQAGLPVDGLRALAAECVAPGAPRAETGVSVGEAVEAASGERLYRVANASERAAFVAFATEPLRAGRAYTASLRCRCEKGEGRVGFRYARAAEGAAGGLPETVPVSTAAFDELRFAVAPSRSGPGECRVWVEPGAELVLSRCALTPDDAVDGWDPQALAVLKAAEPGVVRWPAGRAAERYSWYDGVGPLALRRPVAGAGRELGTAEFVRLCRLLEAEPQIRVTLEVPFDEAAAQRAADWVAYCNAPASHPLGALRARHGCAEPLEVRRWELSLPADARPEAAMLERACRAMAAAMRAADHAVEVGVSLAPGADAALAAAGERACASGLLGWVEVQSAGVRDRYVAGVLGRLEAAGGADAAYFGPWYEGLAAVNETLQRMRAGTGLVFAPCGLGEAVRRDAAGGRSLSEAGALLGLYNRFPPAVPLAVEGVPAESESPLQVAAAWTSGAPMLVAFVYNSGPEPRKIRLDVSPLKRRFAFWAAEQLTAEIGGRRGAAAVPVMRRQKAGAALTQSVSLEVGPASFTRVVVKE